MARTLALRVLEGHGRAYRHTWRGTTITALLTPVLFLAAMGVGVGTLVDEGRAGGVDGVSYLLWLAPGLLAASAMQSGAGDGAFPVMAGMRWIRTYHAAIHTPVRPRDLYLGNLGWAGLRLVVLGTAFVAVAAAFGALGLVRGLLAVPAAVLTGVATCAAVSAVIATRDRDQALAGMFRFVVVPMFLFSGTFFPVDRLPEPLQPVVVLIPLWHGVELTRAVVLGGGPALAWWVHVTALVVLLVGAALVGVRTFERRLLP